MDPVHSKDISENSSHESEADLSFISFAIQLDILVTSLSVLHQIRFSDLPYAHMKYSYSSEYGLLDSEHLRPSSLGDLLLFVPTLEGCG